MPKPISERWCERDQAWLAPFGAYSSKHRRRRYVVLRDEAGHKVRERDVSGARTAFARLLLEDEERRRRQAGPTVADVCLQYLQWHRDAGSRPSTIAGHKFHLTRLVEFEHERSTYGQMPAAAFGLKDLTRIRRWMEEAGADPSYVRHLYMSVKACWTWAARPMEDREPEQILAVNPLDKLQVPGAGQGDDKFVPPDVARQLIEYTTGRVPTVHPNGRWHWQLRLTALKLIVLSGCRPSEAAGLRWDEIDWGARVIVIPPPKLRGKVRTHKTGKRTGKARRIDVRPEIMGDLQAIRDDPRSHPIWTFAANGPRQDGPPAVRALGIWFKGLKAEARAAKIQLPEECTLYWFRHTWQTLGLMVASAEAVSMAAGNSPQVLLRTYASAQNRQVRDVGDRVAAVMQDMEEGRGD